MASDFYHFSEHSAVVEFFINFFSNALDGFPQAESIVCIRDRRIIAFQLGEEILLPCRHPNIVDGVWGRRGLFQSGLVTGTIVVVVVVAAVAHGSS